MVAAGTLDVAKKRKTSESRRFNTLVRMDTELVERARKVAALKGLSVAEYFAEVLRPIVDRDLAREVKKLSGGLESDS
jgi:predicted HicB family RNase H-like nuclease